ncbi:MAG: mandelate racemase/muconate lactonizing enzyme family protein [Rhodospirillales bacterium]|nr:mandelate racemase/muconate lactonizing enzyme family protein [Rhodospirillales bacterium]
MKIEGVVAHACRIPPASPWEDATNKVSGLELIFVEITTDTGLKGTGISYTVDIGGSAIQTLIEDYLVNLAVGMDPLDYERIWNKLNRQARRLGLGVNSMAIAAIDIAIWDIIGKHYGQPLYRLLGGSRDSIPSYISEINLSAADTVDELARRIDEYVARGYRAVKIKIGHDDPEIDFERISKAKEHLGRGKKLLVDLNQKWTAAEATQKATRLDVFDLGWIEEPILYHDIAGHAALKRAIRTPIALGESLYCRQQFQQYLCADAIDVVQADVAFVGGITEWLKIAHLASAFGRPVAPHFMMELSVHLLCGVQNAFMLENVVGGSLTELGLLEEPIVVDGGIGKPSERPGHGILIDWKAVKANALTSELARSAFSGGSK